MSSMIAEAITQVAIAKYPVRSRDTSHHSGIATIPDTSVVYMTGNWIAGNGFIAPTGIGIVWSDLGAMAIWAGIGVAVALRRFSWLPKAATG